MHVEPRQPCAPLVAAGQIDHHVDDLTATVAADVPLATLQAALAARDQWLPIDGDPAAPVGHLVDTNSTGPLRLGFGAWRDLLTGCQFTTGRGDLVTAGGQTMKNVAGYDLTKLMVGNAATFGRLVTVTTRTYRRPTAALLVTFPPDIPLLNALLTTPARPQWSLLTATTLFCGYLGDDATIAFCDREIRAQSPLSVARRSVDDDISHRADLWRSTPPSSPPTPPSLSAATPAPPSSPLAFRASVPPARIPDFVRAVRPPQWVADPAFGIVVGTCPSASHASAWKPLTASLGGSVLFRDPATGNLANYSTSPVEQRIIESLKRAFDPKAQLAPLPPAK